MYGIEVYKPYRIDEGTVEKIGFVSTTDYYGHKIRARSKDFWTERDKSIQSPRFVFIGNCNRKTGNKIYSYK